MKKIIKTALAVIITASFAVTPVKAEISDIKADVNNDKKLNEYDFNSYRKFILGDKTQFKKNVKSDLYYDNKINVLDLVKLRKIIDGTETLWTKDNLPVMDGSTSAIPLEAGFRSRILGISYQDAYDMVEHHKTHESFSLLLSGENDLIFTVPISESQQRQADEAGVHLNFVPVAKEGFVFIVNKNNPVNSLTQEQIKDIYSGAITNWKDVGGNDEPIIAYQRNSDSGSQNLIVEFMGERELMDPNEKSMSPVSDMGSLIKHVAAYDNSEQSIGYSVYSYAAQMYENSSDIKFIAVDGVEPSKDTLADGTYPLINSTYALYTDNAPEKVRKFVDWCTSDEGQITALESGYLPVSDMKLPDSLIPYNSRGTGKSKRKDYKPDYLVSYYSGSIKKSGTEKPVKFIKDTDVQQKINEELVAYMRSDEYLDNYSVSLSFIAVNGYISFKFTDSKYNILATFTFDMRDGTRLRNFSDLFYKNSKFVPVLNAAITDDINDWEYVTRKADFTGLTGNIEKFTVSNLYLPDENPYFPSEHEITFNSYRYHDDPSSYYLTDYMVTGSFFDMSPLIDFSALSDNSYFNTNPDRINYSFRNEWHYKKSKDENGMKYKKLDGSAFHAQEETRQFEDTLDRIYEQTEGKYTRILNQVNPPYREFQDTTLDILFMNRTYEYMFDKDGTRIYSSDIFGKEFSELDDLLYNIKSISMTSNEVTAEFYIAGMEKKYDNKEERVISFDPEHINKDYFITGTEKANKYPCKEMTKKAAFYMKKDDLIDVYPSSFVLDYGPKKVSLQIKKDTLLTTKNSAYSHLGEWYECWYKDTGEYCGWINANSLSGV